MKSELKVALVILAAGIGTRFSQSTNKVWLPLSGRRIISRSLTNAAKSFKNAKLVLVIHPDDEVLARSTLSREARGLTVEIIYGGNTRHQSEAMAIEFLEPAIRTKQIELVLIHDGARPLAQPALFLEIAEVAYREGGAVPTVNVNPREMDTIFHESVVRTQTPQGFLAQQLLDAYRRASLEGFTGTDTATCIEKYCPSIRTKSVPSDVGNVKITYPQDLAIAEHVLAQRGYKN